ncbi:type IV secretory system conjugative DNA transfer family protein [Acinetobacter sp. Marseille-Q1618]|uniref:type IV secretory system conjugative DNA transfer family protein n=1 Tax=Acinetobacter sp. Marseille-Q1618 TaxID=2697502 RepID=UPI00156DB532|nr:type IV secretory system conjugative DNA transfer family protein [Acinetobacter sp. Marseille-Q1618]
MADLPNYAYYLQQTPIIVSQSDSAKQAEANARIEAINTIVTDAARRNGLRARLSEITGIIENNSRKLDTIYNYRGLMINTVVVPPVIIEAHQISDVSTPQTFSVLGTRYEIKENARFSHLPPDWRDFLNFNIESQDVGIDALPNELKPKNSAEEKAFKKAMDKGIEEGVREADAIFSHQLNRLNQSYIGMLKFHQFVLSGKITMPAIARSNVSQVGTGNTMMLNQSNFQITQLARFVDDTRKWNTNTISILERSKVKANKEPVQYVIPVSNVPNQYGVADLEFVTPVAIEAN